MPLTIRIEALSLNAAELEIIRADTQLVFRVLSRLRRRRGIRASRVTAVVADDFAAAVERHYRARPGEQPTPGWYDTERMGGVPVAKTLDQSDDGSDVVIVFDALRWRGAATDVLARVDGIGTAGHEFAHAMLNRARHASGAMNDVVLPSITGHEAARSLARIVGDEYRADRIADEVVAACTHVPKGPSSQGLPWRIATEEHLAAAKNVIESTYPGWPDLVGKYRNYRMPLEEMWSRFGRSFEIALTMLSRCPLGAGQNRCPPTLRLTGA